MAVPFSVPDGDGDAGKVKAFSEAIDHVAAIADIHTLRVTGVNDDTRRSHPNLRTKKEPDRVASKGGSLMPSICLLKAVVEFGCRNALIVSLQQIFDFSQELIDTLPCEGAGEEDRRVTHEFELVV
jgi:hypothetical protein